MLFSFVSFQCFLVFGLKTNSLNFQLSFLGFNFPDICQKRVRLFNLNESKTFSKTSENDINWEIKLNLSSRNKLLKNKHCFSLHFWYFRSFFGGSEFGSQNRQTRRISSESFVRADARHLHLRHQHDGRKGLEAVRVPDLSKAGPHRHQLHRIHWFRERHRTQALDHERSGSVVRHQVDTSHGYLTRFRNKTVFLGNSHCNTSTPSTWLPERTQSCTSAQFIKSRPPPTSTTSDPSTLRATSDTGTGPWEEWLCCALSSRH